ALRAGRQSAAGCAGCRIQLRYTQGAAVANRLTA
ncbi:hypothetical protein EON64_01995, partial [archaeon]